LTISAARSAASSTLKSRNGMTPCYSRAGYRMQSF
jgi:hypothetical protein